MPPPLVIDPKKLQQDKVAEEEQARFEAIAEKVLDILSEEKVLLEEIPRVMTTLTGLINGNIDKAEVGVLRELCNTTKPSENV